MPGIDPHTTARGIAGAGGKKRAWDTGERVEPRNAGGSLLGEYLHQEAPIMTRALGDPRYGPPLQGNPMVLAGEAGLGGVKGLASWAMGELHPDSSRGAKDRAASAVQSALVFPEAEAAVATEGEIANALKYPMQRYVHDAEGREGWFHPSFWNKKTEGGVDKLTEAEHLRPDLRHLRAKPDVIYKGMSHEEYEGFKQTGQINHSAFHTDPQAAEMAATKNAPAEFKPSEGRPAYVVAVRRPHPKDIVGERGTGVEVARPIHANEVIGVHKGTPVRIEPWEEDGGVTLHWEDKGGRHHFPEEMFHGEGIHPASLEEARLPPEEEGGMEEEYTHIPVPKQPGYGGKAGSLFAMGQTQYKGMEGEAEEHEKYRDSVRGR